MKKLSLLCSTVLLFSVTFSQGKVDFTKLTLAYAQKNYDKVKPEVDKLAVDPANANNAEVWLWKMAVDAEYAYNEKLSASCSNCLQSSYDAFKKYETLESDYKQLGEAPFNWRPLAMLYDRNNNLGRENFKAQKWNEALASFETSYSISEIARQHDIWKNGGVVDTPSIINCAVSAQNAQKMDEAFKYFSLAGNLEYGGEADASIYKYLLYTSSEKKDKQAFDKYFAIAQKKYPTENWNDYKAEFISKNYSIDDKLNTYKAEEAKGNFTAMDYRNYGDMFGNPTKEEKLLLEKDPPKKAMIRSVGREAYKKSFAKESEGLIAYNVGILYYTEFNDVDDEQRSNIGKMQDINSNKPVEKDPKKKAMAETKIKIQIDELKKANAALELQTVELSNNAIEWMEKAVALLKDKADKSKMEKSSLRTAVNSLSNLYAYKKDKSRGKDVKAYDIYDAKFKQYETLYNTLN